MLRPHAIIINIVFYALLVAYLRLIFTLFLNIRAYL